MDEGGVKYVLTDWQGSTRAIVSNSGFVQARMDYQAFGEEIGTGTGQRTTNQGFGASNNLSQKYAQTERDSATGLDHTWWRKNENRAGRWTSPDPYNGSMSLGNPQSFNRYSYVENQPTNFVDPSGLLIIIVHYSCRIIGEAGDGRPVYSCDVSFTTFNDNPGGGSTGGTDFGGGGITADNSREVYDDCSRNTSNLPDYSATIDILRVSSAEGISATLLAVTWNGESGFRYGNLENNGNDGTPGNVDIGPLQINYNTFVNWSPLYGNKGDTNKGVIFGTNLEGGQIFNGIINDNLSAGARILKSYSGGDRNRAGLYRTGNGKFRKTKTGQAEYNKRTGLYDSLSKKYNKFFDCMRRGIK